MGSSDLISALDLSDVSERINAQAFCGLASAPQVASGAHSRLDRMLYSIQYSAQVGTVQ